MPAHPEKGSSDAAVTVIIFFDSTTRPRLSPRKDDGGGTQDTAENLRETRMRGRPESDANNSFWQRTRDCRRRHARVALARASDAAAAGGKIVNPDDGRDLFGPAH